MSINLRREISRRLELALKETGAAQPQPLVAPASRPEFGDYQANGALRAGKLMQVNPRALAQRLIDSGVLNDLSTDVSVAGPGFINVTLDNDYLSSALASEPLVTPTREPLRIVVDYSSPNVAKQMHVGHLRSTVIGDSVARMLALAGHRVVRQNHIGDWGTAFGKIVAYIEELGSDQEVGRGLDDLEQLYVTASKRFDEDKNFATRAREAVLKLQSHDLETMAIWQKFIEVSTRHMQEIYDKLDILLTPADIKGESSFNDDLPTVIKRLKESGLLVESDGAQCVFVEGFVSKDGSQLPMIVQKSDGGYLYHTTDLATLLYRTTELKADQVLYFTDARQILHFQMLFAVAKKAGFAPSDVELEHHAFGSILNSQGEPLKTRAGENPLLSDLIKQAETHALHVVSEKSNHLEVAQQTEIAHKVAIGAIKYADLSKNRTSDYKFDLDTMMSLEGNTSPYLQYAHARVNAIFARGGIDSRNVELEKIRVEQPAEHDLAVRLLRFQEVLEQSIDERKAHHMCNFLYDLTVHFTRFYENCPVLNAEKLERESRLGLCARTAETLRVGLDCLGISIPKRM